MIKEEDITVISVYDSEQFLNRSFVKLCIASWKRFFTKAKIRLMSFDEALKVIDNKLPNSLINELLTTHGFGGKAILSDYIRFSLAQKIPNMLWLDTDIWLTPPSNDHNVEVFLKKANSLASKGIYHLGGTTPFFNHKPDKWTSSLKYFYENYYTILTKEDMYTADAGTGALASVVTGVPISVSKDVVDVQSINILPFAHMCGYYVPHGTILWSPTIISSLSLEDTVQALNSIPQYSYDEVPFHVPSANAEMQNAKVSVFVRAKNFAPGEFFIASRLSVRLIFASDLNDFLVAFSKDVGEKNSWFTDIKQIKIKPTKIDASWFLDRYSYIELVYSAVAAHKFCKAKAESCLDYLSDTLIQKIYRYTYYERSKK